MTPHRLKLIETLGFALVGVLGVGILAASSAGTPRWVLDGAVGAGLAIALPTVWLHVHRRGPRG